MSIYVHMYIYTQSHIMIHIYVCMVLPEIGLRVCGSRSERASGQLGSTGLALLDE